MRKASFKVQYPSSKSTTLFGLTAYQTIIGFLLRGLHIVSTHTIMCSLKLSQLRLGDLVKVHNSSVAISDLPF